MSTFSIRLKIRGRWKKGKKFPIVLQSKKSIEGRFNRKVDVFGTSSTKELKLESTGEWRKVVLPLCATRRGARWLVALPFPPNFAHLSGSHGFNSKDWKKIHPLSLMKTVRSYVLRQKFSYDALDRSICLISHWFILSLPLPLESDGKLHNHTSFLSHAQAT